jgi:hypothetical protein
MALRPLKSFFPTADELLQQDLPTLGRILLTHLQSYMGLNTVYQYGGLNRSYFRAMLENRPVGFGPLPNEPEYGARQPDVTKRMMEAWNWLERQGHLIHNDEQPADWFIISSDGEALLKQSVPGGESKVSAFESVTKLGKEWQPQVLPTELKYRDSFISFLRERLKDAKKIEPEYRHLGTTTDIYVEQPGFFGSSAVFVELKRNFNSKAQLDRLVGQLESLEPKKNFIVVILCGEANPALVARLRERYKCAEGDYVVISNVRVIVKEPQEKKT